MLRKFINKIKKKKRWLIDKKPKRITKENVKTNFPWFLPWFLCFLFATIGLVITLIQLDRVQKDRDNFQNLYLTKPIRTVIIRPRLINKVQKEIIEKKVYVRVPVKSKWKHLPERRGAYIR